MSETIRVQLDSGAFSEQIDDVRQELTSLVEDDLNPLANSLQLAFREMSESIVADLENAAARGRISVRGMVDDIVDDLARLAADQLVRQPLANLFSQGSGLGGAVNPSGTPIVRSASQNASVLSKLITLAGRNG